MSYKRGSRKPVKRGQVGNKLRLIRLLHMKRLLFRWRIRSSSGI